MQGLFGDSSECSLGLQAAAVLSEALRPLLCLLGAVCNLACLEFLVILPFNFQLSLHLERGTHHAY